MLHGNRGLCGWTTICPIATARRFSMPRTICRAASATDASPVSQRRKARRGNAANWLGATPCDLRGSDVSPYAFSFAFDGYDPIRVWGLHDLLLQPAGSEAGFFTRHLLVLFEDVANLFAESGINLTLDGFTWDPARIRPFRKNQLYSSGKQGVI